MIQKRSLLLLPLSALLLLPFMPLLGCSNSANTAPIKAQTPEEQMKAIDDNPNMPEQAKAAAKDAILHHQDRK